MTPATSYSLRAIRSGLGVAVARLVNGGFDVITCRQAQSEMEEAFLVLTGAAA